jgi:hypothetical protein
VTDAEAASGDVDVLPLEVVRLSDTHPRLFEHAQRQTPAGPGTRARGRPWALGSPSTQTVDADWVRQT